MADISTVTTIPFATANTVATLSTALSPIRTQLTRKYWTAQRAALRDDDAGNASLGTVRTPHSLVSPQCDDAVTMSARPEPLLPFGMGVVGRASGRTIP